MRWLDFRRLRDLFCIVAEHDCVLRAKDLGEIAIAEGILVNEKGEPFKPTPIYHYRRTLERLELVCLTGRRYCVSRNNSNVQTLLAHRIVKQPLSIEEQKPLSNLVLQNHDCYDAFLSAFIGNEERPTNIGDFIRVGKPVVVNISTSQEAGMHISLRNTESDFQLSFSGENAVQAIFWGLRAWCIDQLQFLDEIFLPQEGYFLFPRDIESPARGATAEKLLNLLEFKGEWATARVGEMILSAGQRWRIPSEAVRETLRWLYKKFPDYVAPISTSEQFVASRVHPSQRRAALNSYVRFPSGELVSHLRIHSRLAESLREKGVE